MSPGSSVLLTLDNCSTSVRAKLKTSITENFLGTTVRVKKSMSPEVNEISETSVASRSAENCSWLASSNPSSRNKKNTASCHPMKRRYNARSTSSLIDGEDVQERLKQGPGTRLWLEEPNGEYRVSEWILCYTGKYEECWVYLQGGQGYMNGTIPAAPGYKGE